ncbi:MAG: GlsB/YeaQ/YmgE family stress response membrane protein [Clostridia bacterium]|nr:GlsB/YeaQ/YmgE family stress response membrane protein [Clostridia bacterium]
MEWLWQLLVAIAIGALSGWLAGKIMKSEGSFLRNLILGIVGGALGGWLGSLIGLGGGWVMSIILAIAGACLVIFLWRLIFKKGKKK